MPTYKYKCPYCTAQCEVDHSMSYVDKEHELPLDTLKQITCQPETCEHELFYRSLEIKNQYEEDHDEVQRFIADHKGVLWKRVPQEVQLAGMMGGSSKTEHELVLDKQRKRKIRSQHEFVNEKLDKLPDDNIKKHFKHKYAKWERKDHEKMK